MSVPLPDNDVLRALIARMATGDRDALAAFVDAVGPWIHAAHRRFTKNAVSAANLLERTVDEVWRQAPLYDRYLGEPLGWVLFLARHEGLSWAESRRNMKNKATEDDRGPRGPAPDTAAARAMATMDADARDLLVRGWHEVLPGGVQGEAERIRLDEALLAFADALDAEGA